LESQNSNSIALALVRALLLILLMANVIKMAEALQNRKPENY
jgi:hypothetical protein